MGRRSWGEGYGLSHLFIVDFEIRDVDCAGICWGGEILDLGEEIGCDAGNETWGSRCAHLM